MTERPQVGLVETADGSWSLYHQGLGVHYRSQHGALTESRHVFLEGCQLPLRTGLWRVLELGFGGGINFLQTAATARACGCSLDYHTIDWAPVAPATLEALHQHAPTTMQPFSALAQDVVAQADIPETTAYSETPQGDIRLWLYPTAWQGANVPADLHAHAIYHDPFDPRTNPEAWSVDCFSWMHTRIASDGILATYSAAAHIRAALVAAGFVLATTAGPAGKREITLAAVDHSILSMYTPLSTERYRKKASARF